MSWSPLVEGAERDRVLAAIRRLAADRARAPLGEPSPNLSNGDPAQALLFAYLAREPAVGVEGAIERAADHLERAIEACGAGAWPSWLFGGWVGTAFAAEHLQAQLFAADGDLVDEVVPVLAEVARAAAGAHFDLISGSAGVALVCLERGHDPAARSVLADLVLHLAARAVPQEIGAAWPEADGVLDLGVAHGAAGVCAVLAQASALGIAGAEAPAREAIRWLLSHDPPPGDDAGLPHMLPDRPGRSRVAWCYGDAGIAAALATCARAFADQALLAHARRIGRRAAARPIEGSAVVDAGLCHGAAGLTLLFQRLWQGTGDPAFADAARMWLRETLSRLDDPREPSLGDAGLLTGTTGVALALLAAASEVEPSWDAALLLSPAAAVRRLRD